MAHSLHLQKQTLRHCRSTARTNVHQSVAAAEHPEIAKRRATERKAFTDTEITEGFFKLTLAAEFQVGRPRRPDPQVRPPGAGFHRQQVRSRTAAVRWIATVADIKHRVEHLDIAVIETARRGHHDRQAWCATATWFGPSAPSTAPIARAASRSRWSRNACRASNATTVPDRVCPTSSWWRTRATLFTTTAPTRNCCRRLGR